MKVIHFDDENQLIKIKLYLNVESTPYIEEFNYPSTMPKI